MSRSRQGLAVSGTLQYAFEVATRRVVYTFPLSALVNNSPALSMLSYQEDGNIVIESSRGRVYYATTGRDAQASILHKSVRAELTDDGRFVLLNKAGKEIWAAKKTLTLYSDGLYLQSGPLR